MFQGDGGDNTEDNPDYDDESDSGDGDASSETSPSGRTLTDISQKCLTLPSKLDLKQVEWDEIDELLQVERNINEHDKIYQTLPVGLPSLSSHSDNETNASTTETDKENKVIKKEHDTGKSSRTSEDDSGVEIKSVQEDNCMDDKSSIEVVRRPPKTGSTAIRRRPGKRRSRTKLKRRCSINGHFYNRETSFFTPPFGSQMSVWVTSLVNTQEVINLILEKYKVESRASNFALFVVRDNGGRSCTCLIY